jgi:hypothetical protein
MKDTPAHIGLLLSNDFPEVLINKFEKEVEYPNLKVEIRQFPSTGMFNSLEWAIPTLIGVYILKPYFESFLSEMGKDHYGILKKWLKKTASETRVINVHTIAATQSPNKLTKGNTQSKVFSVDIFLKNGSHHIKFLFDTNLPIETWDSATDKMLLLIEEHYEQFPNDSISRAIASNNFHRDIWGRINPVTGEWDLLDFQKIALESRAKNQ